MLCLAADISKPECNAHSYGRMWPDAANHNPKLMTKLCNAASCSSVATGVGAIDGNL